MSVFAAFLHSNWGDVSSFARANLIFFGISTVVFRVCSSSGAFLLNVSGNARFFPAGQTICNLGISLKLIEIYKLYD